MLENKFYARPGRHDDHPAAGAAATASCEAVGIDKESGRFDTMRTLAAPVGRGWEYLTGTG